MFRLVATAICGLLWVCGAGAQTAGRESREFPKMVADRPDFTESTDILQVGVVQIEGGVTLERDGVSRNLSQPEILFRTGINRRLEMRFSSDGVQASREDGHKWRSGMADASVAVKVRLFDEHGPFPAAALLPILSMPTGANVFTSGRYEPTLKLALSKDLPAGFSMGGNLNYAYLAGETGRYREKSASVTVGHALFAGLGGYWEVYAISPWEQGSGTAWVADGGISHSIGEHVQLDARVGKRMTAAGPNWFAGVGFAIRRPTRFARW